MPIKLCIMDLDGVLVSTKDLHYEALNKTLEWFNKEPISYEDHIAHYDGKPTKVKLRQYGGFDSNDITILNIKKQEFTADILEESIHKSPKLIDICIKLRSENYKLAVASNSVRYTVYLVLMKLGILRYIDCVMSNEDVIHGKPFAEMYLKCMINTGVGPRDTLILEDSYVGREGVYNSGANLCPVKNPDEVTLEFIQKYINKYNNVKNTWKDNKMNILIPMAGGGTRFKDAGYTFPKPLIDIMGKPMIQTVVENLNIEANYIFIVQKEHYEKYNLKYLLELIAPGCKIIPIDYMTEGAACTTLIAKEYINNNEPLLIANSDQWVQWDSSDFMYSMQGEEIDGGILMFNNIHPKWSYAKVGDNGMVNKVAEKQVISDNATVGIYYWCRGKDYVKYAEQMISKNNRFNNEFYVCPVYNEAIDAGLKIKPYMIKTEDMHGLGDPESLNMFLRMRINDDY